MKTNIYTNLDQSLQITLKIEGDVFEIDAIATVRATLYQGDCAQTSTVQVLSTTQGSDWANSKIVALFDSSEMAQLKEDNYCNLQISISNDPNLLNNNVWTIEKLFVEKGYS